MRLASRLSLLFFTILATGCAAAGDESAPSPPLRSTANAALGEADAPVSYLFEERGAVLGARMMMPVTFDRAHGTALAYGGWTSGSVRADTLEWDGYGWQRRATTGLPGPRFGAALTFDEKRQRALLFGGYGALTPGLVVQPGGMWEWSGGDWQPLATQNTPAARALAAFAVHPDTKEIWMFGGASDTSALDELYRFDGQTWTQIPKPAGAAWPPLRAGATLAFDPSNRHLILFGGVQSVAIGVRGYPELGGLLTDTWSFDGQAWTQLAPARSPGASTLPTKEGVAPLAAGATLVLDEGRNVLVLVHEALAGIELWEWDPVTPTWKLALAPTKDHAPNYRLFSSVFWDQRTRGIAVFGGIGTALPAGIDPIGLAQLLQSYTGNELFNRGLATSAWFFDGQAWRETQGPGDPGARQLAAAAYHAGLKQGLVFGGRFGSDAVLGDTWVWNGGQWNEHIETVAPPSREDASMAYDAVRGAVVLYGGAGPDGTLRDDTWLWNGTWTELDTTGAPGPRRGMTLVASADGVLAFGGRNAGQEFRDTWRLRPDANAWESIDSGDGVVEQSYASCAALAPSGPYLYGGERFGLTGPSEQFHHFVPPSTWSRIVPADDQDFPQAREACALFADPAHDQLLLAGGAGAESKANWYRYDISGDTWHALTPSAHDPTADVPGRVTSGAYFFDETSGTATLYGGYTADLQVVSSRTWRLREVGAACTAERACPGGLTCVDGACCEATTCGPCESCAMPGRRGVCTPRGAVESTPGCPAAEGLACAVSGRCRTADGSQCVQDAQCASGTCISGICCSAAGCTERCLDDTHQQNPDGTQTDCGAYKCRGSSCASTCDSVSDCNPGTVCTETHQCVPVATSGGGGDEPGGCQTLPGGGLASGLGSTWLLVALGVLGRRRRYSTIS